VGGWKNIYHDRVEQTEEVEDDKAEGEVGYSSLIGISRRILSQMENILGRLTEARMVSFGQTSFNQNISCKCTVNSFIA
jgi:hypothetical protein